MRGDDIHKCEADLLVGARSWSRHSSERHMSSSRIPWADRPFQPSERRDDGGFGAGISTYLRCDRSQIQDTALAPTKSQVSGFSASRGTRGPSLAPDFRIRDIAGNECREVRHPECVRLVGYIHFGYIEIPKSAVQGSLPPDEPTRITPANMCALRE